MDISHTFLLLLTNLAKYSLRNGEKPVRKLFIGPAKTMFAWLRWRYQLSNGTKIYVVILPLILILSGTLLFYEFKATPAGADFEEKYLIPEIVLFRGGFLAAVSNPSVFSHEILGATMVGSNLLPRVNVVVTAYSSTPWETDGNPYITASGVWVGDGIIANNMLAFGTRVRIPEIFGDKIFVVQDRMHWRKSDYQVDVWFPSFKEALDFGTKRTYIEILES